LVPLATCRLLSQSGARRLDANDFESHYQYQSRMILCLCKGISERTVRLAVATGARSVDAVADRCGAGTDCGSCRHAIQDLVDAEAAPEPMECGDSASSAIG
jgi:bacterioferritin-associated ferredoxin